MKPLLAFSYKDYCIARYSIMNVDSNTEIIKKHL